MDFKKLFDQAKDAAEDLKDKAGAKVKEIRESLDKDGDNVPDALEGLTEKAKGLAGLAGEKLEQVGAKLGELVDQGQAKLEEVKGEARKAANAAREKVG